MGTPDREWYFLQPDLASLVWSRTNRLQPLRLGVPPCTEGELVELLTRIGS